ncbi:hypothetical protein [Phaeobacter sp.]|uniref:vWA domain-containing protein n=1 Tax=Phaeobacter sp. TaxID=1902409 RepID=UPI0025E9292A|nr:hypothetical protein [Phaeobacter sp.]
MRYNDQNLGLIAYGHRRKGDCGDIETLVPLNVGNSARITEQLRILRPKGKTPISDAVRLAAEEMRFTEETATVVLISDGVETCAADPCATARTLEEAGIDFTAHVIGFDIKDAAANAQLACIAEETGGSFLSAQNAADLSLAVTTVVEDVQNTQNQTVSEPRPIVARDDTLDAAFVACVRARAQAHPDPLVQSFSTAADLTDVSAVTALQSFTVAMFLQSLFASCGNP